MVENGKLPYQPSQTHRFFVSPDMYSQERFGAIQLAVKKAMREYPAIVDAVLMGSLSKGKTLAPNNLTNTDIDLVFFVDSGKALKTHHSLLANDFIYRDYAGLFQSFRFTDPDLSYEIHSNRALDIATEVISSNLSEGNKFDLESSTIAAKPIALSGRRAILDQINSQFWSSDWTSKQAPLMDNMPDELAQNIAAVALFWGWDMNGGLRPYREAFFADLEKLGQQKNNQTGRQ